MARDRAVLGLCLLAAFRSMAQSGMLLFLPLYVADVIGANPVMVGATVMAMHLGGVIVSPIAGVISDRIGRRPVILAGLSASTVAIITLTFLDSTTAFVIGVSVLGFLLFGVRPVIQSWMMDIAPAQMRGSATSLLFGTQSLFSMAMPLIGGVIADTYGLSEVFYAIAVAILLANSAIFLLPATESRK
jgi:FSR family fosmidomycin resistance protein-like MFS transporter